MFQRLREIIKEFPSFSGLEVFILDIENAGTDDAVFDHCKSLIDAICKTILKDKGVPFTDDEEDTPGIFRLANECINRGLIESVATKKITSGLNVLVQGICELRNEFGRVSHGKDLHAIPATDAHRRIGVSATAILASSLMELFKEFYSPSGESRIHHENNPEFNEWFDEQNPDVQIGKLSYSASEVLCKCDPDAYREALIEFTAAGHEEVNPVYGQ